jgi:hypothetical protein
MWRLISLPENSKRVCHERRSLRRNFRKCENVRRMPRRNFSKYWMTPQREERMEDIQKETNMGKAEMFDAIVKKMADTYRMKNADYGDSFSKSIDEFGYTAALVPMSDKFNRLKNLLQNDVEAKVKDESVKDTILDLANYSVMLAIEVESRYAKKDEGNE